MPGGALPSRNLVLLPLVRRPRLEVVPASSAVQAPAALPIPAAFAANLGCPWRIWVVEQGGESEGRLVIPTGRQVIPATGIGLLPSSW